MISSEPPPIRVKFLSKSRPGADATPWLRRLPGRSPRLGRCEFVFDRDCRDYDWLVVYEDMPSATGERFTRWEERLACPRAQTLFMTVEPSSIKIYGAAFLRQFGHVLTSQEPWAIAHPGKIHSQAGLVWFYGGDTDRASHDSLVANPPAVKSEMISTVCSSKRQRHTLHNLRYDFTQRLKAELPELQIFGHGVRYIADKAEALDSFRYHLAIENHVAPHHWTEKLADSFLGLCLPFYHGCPNYADYFPPDSVIPINLHDFGQSLAIIRAAIRNGEYERRLTALREARRRYLEEHATFQLLRRLIEERTPASVPRPGTAPESILSRRAFHRRYPWHAAAQFLERARARLKHRLADTRPTR